MTTRPIPARVVPRRSWAMPFARATRRGPGAAGPEANARQQPAGAVPPVQPNADEDFLRRLREAGL